MIAVLFPGQGSQQAGMGADIAAAHAGARSVFEQADDVLGMPLSRLCFEGPNEALLPTEVAQPALLATSWALFTAAREALGDIAAVAGHSLGEYTALVAAGVIDFPTALRLVRRRGELMRDAAAGRGGGMAAVLKLEDEVVERLCEQVDGTVVPANYNSPGQVVVSGAASALDALEPGVVEAGGRFVRLAVSGAFHSPLMATAAEGLAVELAPLAFRDARMPVVQNVTAEAVTDGERLREGLVAQLAGSVRWTASVRTLCGLSVRKVVEVGPRDVLCGLVRRTAPSLPSYAASGVEALDGLANWVQDEVTDG